MTVDLGGEAVLASGVRAVVRGLSFHPPGTSAEEVIRGHGVPPERIVRLGSNENPYGPSPKVAQALDRDRDCLNCYPAGLYAPLKTRIAELNGLTESEVEIGPGAESIIRYLAMLLVDPGDELVIQRQSFDAAPWWVTVMGGSVRYIDAVDYQHDVAAYAAAVGPRTRLLWLTNPDNPTGSILRRRDVEELLEHVSGDVVVVFDQAYREYANDADYLDALEMLKDGARNVVVLRTFSKAYGLAGLRLGYLLAHRSLCAAFDGVHEPFHVARPAAVAGVAALDDQPWMQQVVTRTIAERRHLAEELVALGCTVVPSQANFLLVRFPHDTADLARSLLEQGVIVRPAHKWGYGDHLRITVGRPDHSDRLLEELHGLLVCRLAPWAQ